MKIMVTGGAGFIGANFLNGLVPKLQDHQFINVDKLTYAANLGSLQAIESLPNYTLRRVDITDMDGVDVVFDEFDPDLVVHFAAESHVDRSILGPREFVRTNIEGTFNLLE
ncbi:MAG: GDP-mannose 4,6-dehydratase, partial [Polyangiales bacterium]